MSLGLAAIEDEVSQIVVSATAALQRSLVLSSHILLAPGSHSATTSGLSPATI